MRVILNGEEYKELIKSKQLYKREAYDEVYKQANDNQQAFFGQVARLMEEYLEETKYPQFQAMTGHTPIEVIELRGKINKLIDSYKLEIRNT